MTWGRTEAKKVIALTRRDMLNWASYKSQMMTTIATSILALASWGFIATFRNVPVPEYNTDYVSFLIVGILVSQGIIPLSKGINKQLNPWTLETVLMTGVRPVTFVLGIVAWSWLLSVIFLVPQILLGIFLFGAVLNVNILSLSIAVMISMIIIFSMGMISTGVRLVTKVNDPVTWALVTGGSIFAGMTFPISHLDSFLPGLSNFSWALPHTWIYHIVRLSALSNASLLEPSVALAFLGAALIAIIMFALGVYSFGRGLRRAKREGTLGWY